MSKKFTLKDIQGDIALTIQWDDAGSHEYVWKPSETEITDGIEIAFDSGNLNGMGLPSAESKETGWSNVAFAFTASGAPPQTWTDSQFLQVSSFTVTGVNQSGESMKSEFDSAEFTVGGTVLEADAGNGPIEEKTSLLTGENPSDASVSPVSITNTKDEDGKILDLTLKGPMKIWTQDSDEQPITASKAVIISPSGGNYEDFQVESVQEELFVTVKGSNIKCEMQEDTQTISGKNLTVWLMSSNSKTAEQTEITLYVDRTDVSARSGMPLIALTIVLGVLLAASLLVPRIRSLIRGKNRNPRNSDRPVVRPYEHTSEATDPPPHYPSDQQSVSMTVGTLHQIGKRQSQQDSMDAVILPDGVIGVVADGMGGLSDGDKVSQKIVQTIHNDASGRTVAQLSDNLLQMVTHANTEVNHMLGYSTSYRSGSTLVLAAAEPHQFRWASVGDSRIYLYRGGGLIQINREHSFEAELLRQAVNREVTFNEARTHAKRKSVTSFIGMGTLKKVDFGLHPVRTLPGDRLLLCSDGVFNALPESEIAHILGMNREATSAAAALGQAVLSKEILQQDNFSAVLIFYR